MNETLLLFDVVAIVLAALLAGIGFAAARRYRDRRFVFVGTALAVVGVVGGVGAVDVLWSDAIPDGQLGIVPVLLLIASEVLLYLSFVAPRGKIPRPPNP